MNGSAATIDEAALTMVETAKNTAVQNAEEVQEDNSTKKENKEETAESTRILRYDEV